MIATSTSRLLAGFHAHGHASDLGDHLTRLGPPPLPADRGLLVDAVDRAGLTGRGGAAFPTARKLRSVASSRRSAVVVVNATESEPASTKDRLLLAVAPHLVLDGATLAAQAVGAREIFVCTHAGGTPAAEAAVTERVDARLDPVPITVTGVPARYVSGEETSLVSWINDGTAKPVFTPPRPFERGVYGRPTLISNAETYAHIALIARYGPEWFRSCGTDDAPGTALFTVSGAVNSPGVVEVPLGTSLVELLRMAGGPSEALQALLAGGYGGTWLPPSMANTALTPAAFAEAGATFGPGIIVALPSRVCGVAESARILRWLAAQTAGQCGPCVHGLPAIAEDFTAIAACRADTDVYQRIRRRLSVIQGRGACRHPDGAVRFAASALRVFGKHLRIHERTGGCPAALRGGFLQLPGRR